MKFLVALLSVLALTKGQDLCQQCAGGVQMLGEFLLTDVEIEAVEAGLIDLVCSTLEDPEGCATGVYTWWPQIAEALFKYEGTATAICVGIGDCTRKNPLVTQDFTCEQCEHFLHRVDDLLETDAFAQKVAADLSGAVFCENTDYITAENAEACKGFMDLAAIPSIKALGHLLHAGEERICKEGGCTV